MARGWIAALALAGCAKGNGEDRGPHCEDTPTVVGIDEVTELGFAARALVDLAQGTWAETFTWARDGSAEAVTVTVAWSDGEARFVDSEAVYPDGGEQPAIAVICDDRVEVDVTAGFATASGAFDEAWDGPLVGLSAALATAYRELDPDALGGSYDMDLDTAGEDYDERSLWVRAAFDGAGSSGVVEGQISGGEPCDEGDTCTAWAAQVSVGSWGEAGS